jgi:hypothetical protein|tara:strand:+ start:1061 stop:1369 length:309 start_codon:yes stop_codon:yes gene_type:complete
VASYFNVTSSNTQELVAPGNGQRITSISLVNIKGVSPFNLCRVDLFIKKSLKGTFYILKDVPLQVGDTLKHDFTFDNGTNQFGLYLKITSVVGDVGVDVILN